MKRFIFFALFAIFTIVHVQALDEQTLYRDNVVIALDVSGSMDDDMHGSTRMRIAQDALKTVASQLSATTQVGLYAFGGKNNSGWYYPLGPLDQRKLERAIERARPGGATPLGAALKQCGNALLEQRQQQLGYGTYRLLVVTDGEASDAALMERIIPQILARGITFDAIGLDMSGDHSLATKVHNYRRAEDKKSLTQAIAASFAEVGGDDQGTSDEWFADLAGLESGIADAAITAYAQSGNHPISSNPQNHAASSQGDQLGQTPSTGSSTKNDGFALPWWAFIAIVIVIIAIKNVLGKINK